LKQILKSKDSLTAAYLNGTREIAVPKTRRKGNKKKLTVHNARANAARTEAFSELNWKEGRDPTIILLDSYLHADQMPALFAAADAFVLPTRGEGWGLHQHQALMCGVPLISPRFGGVAEYFSPRDGWVIRHRLAPATGYFEGMGLWCEPDHNSAVWALRDAKAQWDSGVVTPSSPWANCWSEIRKFSSGRMVSRTLDVLREFDLA
jgi:glycosyltransferase involved in cell wall biosynthesis